MKIQQGRPTWTTPLALLLLLSLTACPTATTSQGQSSSTSSTSSSTSPQPDFIYAAHVAAKSEQVPDEIKVVGAAIAARMAGQTAQEIEASLPVKQSGKVQPRPDFPLAGFAWTEMMITRAHVREDGSEARDLALQLHFIDGFGRLASLNTLVTYQLAGGDVLLSDVQLYPVATPLARFNSYLVPFPAAKTATESATDYNSLYLNVTEAALEKAETSKQLAQGGDFLLATFGMTRLQPGSRLRLEISETAHGPALNDAEDAEVIIFPGGYPVILLPATLKTEADSPIWVRILQDLGPGASKKSKRKAILVDHFPLSSQTGDS